MDADYLKAHVGTALAKALSEVVVKNPEDAIDFIGNFLIKYANDNEELSSEPLKITETSTIKAATQAVADQAVATQNTAAEALAAQLKDDEALFAELAEAQARFESPEDGVVKPNLGSELRAKTMAVVQKVIDYVKSRTGADACYMGELRSMPEDGPKFLAYTSVGAESKFLMSQGVAITEPEPDEEEPKPETGAVTWTLFDPVHDEPPPEPEMPEDADPETWVAPVVPPPLPPKVHVQNVLREERMKFHRFPRMGAYLAARIKYNNSIHEAALNEEHLTADPYPEPIEGEEVDEEAAAEAEAAAAEEAATAAEGEVAADGEEAVVEVPKKELKVWEANTSEIKGVLSVDTMGTGRPFTAEEELFVQKAAEAVGIFLEKMTKHQYQAEVSLQRARLTSNAAVAEGAEARAEETAATFESEMAKAMGVAPAAEAGAEEEAPAAEEEAPAAEEEAAEGETEAPAAVEMSEEEKATHETRIKMNQATGFAASQSENLANVLLQLCSPPAGVVDALSASFEMLGTDMSKCIDGTTKQVAWSKLSSTVVVADSLAALQALVGTSFNAEDSAKWRERLGAVDAGDYSAAVTSLVTSATTVLDHCDACEVIRAAEEAARIAAEEEAAAAAAAAAEATEEVEDE